MAPERRNDIGNKALGAVLALLVSVVAGASVTQSQANAKEIVKNKVCVAEIKVTQDYTIETLKRIESKLN